MREPRGREVWSGYAPNSATDRVLGLCAELIDRHTLRSPMPLVVLRAAREHPAPGESEGVADEAVEDAVKFIHRAHRPRGLLCRVIGPGSRPSDAGDDAYARTAAVLADLTSQAWENDKLPRARPYAFPRSRLLAAIEEAVSLDDDRSVLERLDRMRWRPRPSRADGEGWLPRFLRVTLSPAGVVGAILTAGLGALAGQAKGQGMAVALAAAVLLVAGLAVHSWSRHHEGLLPWHDPSGRWLSTTTFLAASGTDPATWSTWRPRLSRAARDARAGEIAHAVGLARGPVPSPERDRARQFHLQLRALALLEDLRADHRPRLGVRPRGRAVPPVVFIPRATDANGGIALLRAISDVRSRRSELDPLLVVAGIARADEDGLDSRASAADPVGTLPDPRRLYQAWVEDHLRVGQSPSIDSGLPWVLPVRLAPVLLRTAGTEAHVMRRIGPGPWAQLGRRLTAVTAVLAALGGSLAYVHYHPFDCEGAPFTGETTAFRTGDGWECVGVTDGSITFATSGPRLGGTAAGTRQGEENPDLAALQKKILAENRKVADKKHITIVYANELSRVPGDASQDDSAVSSLRELAGIHVQQRITNDSNKPWNIQVVMANGGHKMLYQEQMIAHILDYARRDPSVVAVVGMSRDTAGTEKSVRRLKKAGLVLVSTANSDNDLAARHLNYFSLAATNKEEADRLAKTVEKAEPELLGNGTKALVLASPREDPYHEQQAAAAQHALKNLNPETLSLDDGEMVQPENARVTDAVCTLQPTVIYLAGRSTDLPGLAAILDEKEECYKKKGARVAVLAGDDMTKSQAVDGLAELPEYATLYYAAFASPNSIEASQLPRNTRKVFRIRQATSPSGPFFADGSMALGYDAADVVYEAAAESGAFTRPMMSGALRGVRLTSSASGVVDFCVPPGNNQTNHSLVIFKVAGRGHPRAGQPHLVHPPETPETQTAVSPCAPRQG